MLRISRRNIGRDRWRSALVVVLVMLPVAGMVGGITYLRTTTPTPEAAAVSALGTADLLIVPTPTGPASTAATADHLRSLLPAGSRVEAITWTQTALVLPGRKATVIVRAMDLEGLAAGIGQLTAGRLPAAPDEVAITRAVAALAGVEIGERIEVEGFSPATVVGLVESPESLSSRLVLQHPSLAEGPGMEPHRSILVTLPPGAEVPELGLEFEVQARAQWAGSSGGATVGMLIFGGLVLIETALIASAAFAVSIRRRQRELGVLTASGAQPRHLAGTVLGEGLVLGGLAATIGAAIGIAVVFALTPWLDQLADRRNPPLTLDWTAIGLAATIGTLAAVAAAAIPAWTAARLPALIALSGRRPPTTSARRTLVLGLTLIAVSALLTVTGASIILEQPGDGGAALMLVGAAILGVVGFGACSPWLVERLEWVGVRLPVWARIAMRDTARARSRSAPIITAMLASLAVMIAISTALTSTSAMSDWRPWLRPDQLHIEGLHEQVDLGPTLANELGALAGMPLTGVVTADGSDRRMQLVYSPTGAAPRISETSASAGPVIDCDDCLSAPVVIGDAEVLRTLGAEAALDDFRAGAVVVLTEHPVDLHEAVIRVGEPATEFDDYGQPLEEGRTLEAEIVRATAVAVGLANGGGRLPGAVIPETLALRLGFVVDEAWGSYLIRLDHAVTEADVAAAAALLADAPDAFVQTPFAPEPPATEGPRMLVFVVSLLLALTVTAIAVALGEAEARADQRTLLSVGADPRIRRRIVAARAAVLALIAGLLAVPAGLLPVWGLLAGRGGTLVIPIPEIVGIVAVIPAVAAAGALLLGRPIPAWSALRDLSA